MRPELDLSIVIVSWNTRGVLGDCLRSVFDRRRALEDVGAMDEDSSAGGNLGSLCGPAGSCRFSHMG